MLSKLKKLIQFRVKRWQVAMRGSNVLIVMEDSIWYWALLDWLALDCGLVMCSWLVCKDTGWRRFLKLPRFIRDWKRVWDKEWDEEPSTFEDYYGDDLSTIWHCCVEGPILQWIWKHKDYWRKRPEFELTLAEAKEKFDDPEQFQWIEERIAEDAKYEAEKAAEELAKNKE